MRRWRLIATGVAVVFLALALVTGSSSAGLVAFVVLATMFSFAALARGLFGKSAPRMATAGADAAEFDALPPWAHRLRFLAIILTASPWILVNLARHLPIWCLAVIAILYGVIGLPVLLPQKVAVGDDGILLRWAGHRRFVPFAKLLDVMPTQLGVSLVFPEGPPLEVRLSHRPDAESQRRDALLVKIQRGMAAHREHERVEDEALLARGTRAVDAWISEMAALGAGDAQGYRSNAVPRDRLWAVLENPSADPSARQGAAIALHGRLDEEDRARLATIAERSASPRLRVAVDAVARAPSVGAVRIALDTADTLEEEPDATPRRRALRT